MKKLFKILISSLVILHLIVVFAPKERLFFLGEKFLSDQKIVISDERFFDLGLYFGLENPTIYYDKIAVASLDKLSIFTSLFFTQITISPFSLSPEISMMIDASFDKSTITHHAVKPHIVSIHTSGNFGEARGEIDLIKRNIKLIVTMSADQRRKFGEIVKLLKNTEDGLVYEQSF